jgi:hypothetical protein
MAKQSDYPPIDSLRKTNAPISILQKIFEVPGIQERLEGDVIKIEAFKKSFWGKITKVLGVTFQIISDPDEATKSFAPDSNGKIFGFIVVEKDKETYRALYDTGVLKKCSETLKKLHGEKFLEYYLMNDFAMAEWCTSKSGVYKRLLEFNQRIEKLFE